MVYLLTYVKYVTSGYILYFSVIYILFLSLFLYLDSS